MKFYKQISEKLTGLTARFQWLSPPLLLYKLLCSWFAVCIGMILTTKTAFSEKLWFAGKQFWVFLLLVLVCWIILLPLEKKSLIHLLSVALAMCYSLCAIYEKPDTYFAIICAAIVTMILFTCQEIHVKRDLSKPLFLILCAVCGVAFTVYIGGICCMYYLNHWTSCYDFGLFAQMFHYMRTTGQPLTTCERDALLSHFAVHISPAYYFMLPFYWIFPDPRTLLVLQPLVIALGIIPLVLICRRHTLSRYVTAAFVLIYTFFAAFTGGNWYYLHENCLLPVLILWLLWAFEAKKPVFQFIFAFAVLMVKEDAAVYVAVIALYYLFAEKRFQTALPIFGCALLWFLLATHMLSTSGDGVMSSRYENVIYDNSGSLFTVIKAVIQNPAFVLAQCFTEKKLLYILQMLVPLCFLPFLTKHPSRFILLIPFFLVNLMTNYDYQYDINFQYNFGSGVLLIFLSVRNYLDMKDQANAKKLLLSAVCAAPLIWCGLYAHRLDYLEDFRKQRAQRNVINEATALIPEDASVVSSTYILPNLSQRDVLYQLETTKNRAEYYVLDLRYQTSEFALADYQTDQYEQIYLNEHIIGIFRDKTYTGQ